MLEKEEITKEEFDMLETMAIKKAYQQVKNIAYECGYHGYIPAGYGFYRPNWYSTSDGRYFISWEHEDSCD